ncbi:MAG: hypothetical protein R3F31_12220 [Verrucomicrobiales bacterium]
MIKFYLQALTLGSGSARSALLFVYAAFRECQPPVSSMRWTTFIEAAAWLAFVVGWGALIALFFVKSADPHPTGTAQQVSAADDTQLQLNTRLKRCGSRPYRRSDEVGDIAGHWRACSGRF